jgi:hypothetical protein
MSNEKSFSFTGIECAIIKRNYLTIQYNKRGYFIFKGAIKIDFIYLLIL